MWVDNLEEFGYLINPEKFDSTKTHPELHEIYENQPAWEERYIHKQYPNIFRNDSEVLLQVSSQILNKRSLVQEIDFISTFLLSNRPERNSIHSTALS